MDILSLNNAAGFSFTTDTNVCIKLDKQVLSNLSLLFKTRLWNLYLTSRCRILIYSYIKQVVNHLIGKHLGFLGSIFFFFFFYAIDCKKEFTENTPCSQKTLALPKRRKNWSSKKERRYEGVCAPWFWMFESYKCRGKTEAGREFQFLEVMGTNVLVECGSLYQFNREVMLGSANRVLRTEQILGAEGLLISTHQSTCCDSIYKIEKAR